MPNSVSVNTMCFFFHAGFGALLFSTFCTGLNASKELRLWLLKSPASRHHADLVLPQPPGANQGWAVTSFCPKTSSAAGSTCLVLTSWEDHTFQGTVVSQILGMIKKQKTLHKNKFRRKTLVGHTFNLSLIGDPNLNSTAPQDPQCLPYALDMGQSTSF